MPLDARTLIVVTSVVALMAALSLVWVLGASREKGAGLWALSLVFTAVATGMLAARGIQATPGLVALRTVLFGLSYGLRYYALCSFFEVRRRPALLYGPAALQVGIVVGITGQPVLAIALVDLVRFLQNALLVGVMARHGSIRRNRADGLMVTGLLVFSAVFLLRGIPALVDPRSFASLAATSPFQSGTWMASFLATIVTSFALVLMYRQRVTDDLARGAARLSDALSFNATVLIDSPIPMGVFAASGRCVQANDALARLVGTSREMVLSQNFRELESWRTSGLLALAEAALSRRSRQAGMAHLVTSFGSESWVDCRMSPTYLNGELHLLAQFLDQTEPHRQREALVAQKEALEATLARTKRLEGLLSVCMHCKRIDNDTESWLQIEKYVSDNSDARFTHTICPACLKEHHPGLEP